MCSYNCSWANRDVEIGLSVVNAHLMSHDAHRLCHVSLSLNKLGLVLILGILIDYSPKLTSLE